MKRYVETGRGADTKINHPAFAPVEDMVPEDFLAPLMAGARARGIADAYEMMGLGAILLDASGKVLHASQRAQTMMQGAISIVSEHMAGASPGLNKIIETVIAAGLAENGEAAPMAVIVTASGKRIGLRALQVPVAPEHSVQLMKAVAILSEL